MSDGRYNSVKTVLLLILLANAAVAAVKILVGIACKSQSVIADGIHSVADGSSNIVGLIGIWLASKPRDKQHPYGHEKYEIMASLFIGVMLVIMSVRIVIRAAECLANPVELSVGHIQIILMILTIAVNAIVATVEYRYGKKLKSMILITDSLHTRGDVLVSCAVLTGIFCIKMGMPVWIDGVLSILVAVAVLVSAWQIIKNCVGVLVDSNSVESGEVKKLLITVPGIYDIHGVRSRGEVSHIFIDFHVVVNKNENIENIHTLSHRLETVLKEHFGENTEVNIHFEPDNNASEK